VDTQQAVTVAIRPCHSCGGGVPESDRFCRLCGENQLVLSTVTIEAAPQPCDAQHDIPRYCRFDSASMPGTVTSGTGISGTGTSGAVDAGPLNHPISGPVIWALSTTGGGLARVYDPRMKRVVSVLISVPVWLIILLLSPLDAYAAARLITEARWQQENV
jgi:hypothetical protein